MLTAKVRDLIISPIDIEDEKGFIVPIQQLLSYVPECYALGFSPCHGSTQYGYTNKTAQELVLLKLKKKIHSFLLLDVPQTFNADAFALFIRKHADYGFSFGIKFDESVETIFKTAFENRVMASLSLCISEFGNFKLRVT
uniref:Uncharacterized protein n=1 Tax=Panagrolaimus sp. PS1159 TaxID=55785 RepID=A0AC35G9E4_9BILA